MQRRLGRYCLDGAFPPRRVREHGVLDKGAKALVAKRSRRQRINHGACENFGLRTPDGHRIVCGEII